MPSPPFIYCCVPREGIMAFCFWYGLMNLTALAIVGALISLNQETFDWLMSILDPNGEVEDTLMDYFLLLAQTVIGLAYMYGSYLAYKRKFKPFKTLLYFFTADLAWTLWNVSQEFKNAYYLVRGGKTASVDEVIPSSNLTMTTYQPENKTGGSSGNATLVILSFVFFFFVLIPFLNKLYVIMKIRAYVKYVEYKKDEAELSTTIMEAPQKHPEISKD